MKNYKNALIKGMMILIGVLFLCGFSQKTEAKSLKLLFTGDIHSYLDIKKGYVDGKLREFGGAARLSTLVKENKDEHTLYVDGGDIAMGTLYQAAFSTDAYELRTLGLCGCDVTTFGNHEFDYGCKGVADYLNAAMKSNDVLPQIVESSFNFDGELTGEQQEMIDAMDLYGVCDFMIRDVDGVKVAIFGIEGPDSIECVQSDVAFNDYIEVAKNTVAAIADKADVIVCLSHGGTNGDGETGEDFDLIEQVPGIDVVISAHSHTAYQDAVIKNNTILCSAGSYLQYLGSVELDVTDDGVKLADYKLLPIDESVKEDEVVKATLKGYKEKIKNGYLKEYAGGGDYDDILCESDFDMISYDDMYSTHQEYNVGNLIADSYLYEARKNGINDINVALVGLGTIRGSITKGPVRLADAFEICSLGVGSDGSAGHPLLTAYVTGSELKLLSELDASLGSSVSSIKMSYSGLEYKFNEDRMLLDRVEDVHLISANGRKITEIKDDKLYKVCCNMYAANMLGMLNGLTKGVLSITPKYEDGTVITDFYTVAMKDVNGKEIKEWIAMKDYLSSFEDGKVPDYYSVKIGRKVKTAEGGLAAIRNPGLATWIVIIVVIVIILIILLIVRGIRRRKRKKKALKQEE